MGRHGPPARIEPRHEIRVPVEYQHPTVVGKGTSRDVSLSGARIDEVSFPIRVGAGVMVRFSFFPGSLETWFPGDVVRHTSDGFAVRFVDLDRAHLEILRRALTGAGSA